MDPYYRTIEGFQVLVEKEWLNFGHKFGDRCGHGVGSDDTNERCPVFLQWIDCIYQLLCQYPCSFEFSTSYLIKLAQHVYSCLFGTFLCNTLKERLENSIHDRTFSIWPFLSASIYKNPLYQPSCEKVLWPSHNVRSLVFWSEFYFGSFHTCNSKNSNNNINNISKDFSCESHCENGLTKTRSFSDLAIESSKQTKNSATRRLSDPSMSYDEKISTNIFQENSNINFAANNSIVKYEASRDHDQVDLGVTTTIKCDDTVDSTTTQCDMSSEGGSSENNEKKECAEKVKKKKKYFY